MSDNVDVIRQALLHGPTYADSDDTTPLDALDELVAERDGASFLKNCAEAALLKEQIDRDEWVRATADNGAALDLLAAVLKDVQTAIGFALAEKNTLSGIEMQMLRPRIDAALAAAERPAE